jgi:hypothetical protein
MSLGDVDMEASQPGYPQPRAPETNYTPGAGCIKK